MRMIRLGLLLVAGAHALAATPARAQAVICCSQNIEVSGGWTGSSRVSDCQDYFNNAPASILRRMCQQRAALSCINTARCSELPPEDVASQESSNPRTALPSIPDAEGLADGFGGPPPAPSPPPPSGLSPPCLVYLMQWPNDGKPVTSFTVWLDRNACPLALDRNNRLTDSTAAKHVVRGRIMRRDGRVNIEAEAQERPGGAKLGPVTGEAEGEDTAAVAKATRAVTEKLKLVCAR